MSDRCRVAIERALSRAVASAEFVFSDSDGEAFPEVTINRYPRLALRLAGSLVRRARDLGIGVGGAGLFSDGKFSYFPSAPQLHDCRETAASFHTFDGKNVLEAF
ncbi:MAG: hypothetical protein QOI24_2979 [Acidobacteriota bacterium]|jgi:uncharacterized FAD-dependent dehydrogenase|nr:hypothetical protein [Acidobacteriota bacterium]